MTALQRLVSTLSPSPTFIWIFSFSRLLCPYCLFPPQYGFHPQHSLLTVGLCLRGGVGYICYGSLLRVHGARAAPAPPTVVLCSPTDWSQQDSAGSWGHRRPFCLLSVSCNTHILTSPVTDSSPHIYWGYTGICFPTT